MINKPEDIGRMVGAASQVRPEPPRTTLTTSAADLSSDAATTKAKPTEDAYDPMTYEVHNYRDDYYFSGEEGSMWPSDIEIITMWDELKRDTVALWTQLNHLRDEFRAQGGRDRDGWVSDDDDDDDDHIVPGKNVQHAYERGRRDQQTIIADWVRDNPDILYSRKIADDIASGAYPDGLTW